jgi:hypothetical protein
MDCQSSCSFSNCKNKCSIKGEHSTHLCESSHVCQKKCDSKLFPGFCSVDKGIDLGKSKTQVGHRENWFNFLFFNFSVPKSFLL